MNPNARCLLSTPESLPFVQELKQLKVIIGIRANLNLVLGVAYLWNKFRLLDKAESRFFEPLRLLCGNGCAECVR